MTDLEQALALSGAIFVAIMLSQYGDRDVTWHKFVFPVLTLGGFAWYYLKDAPTAGVDWAVYGVGALVGLAFGIGAAAATRVYRRADGKVRTVTGPLFAGIWLSSVALRIVFVVLAEHNDSFRSHLGQFMYDNRILETAIAPFFLVMAAVMVISRVVLIGVRVSTARPVEAPVERVAVAA